MLVVSLQWPPHLRLAMQEGDLIPLTPSVTESLPHTMQTLSNYFLTSSTFVMNIQTLYTSFAPVSQWGISPLSLELSFFRTMFPILLILLSLINTSRRRWPQRGWVVHSPRRWWRRSSAPSNAPLAQWILRIRDLVNLPSSGWFTICPRDPSSTLPPMTTLTPINFQSDLVRQWMSQKLWVPFFFSSFSLNTSDLRGLGYLQPPFAPSHTCLVGLIHVSHWLRWHLQWSMILLVVSQSEMDISTLITSLLLSITWSWC